MGVSQGQLLANKYRVERVLGRGGMGVVVAAHHIQLNQKVAIKFLLPEALSKADTVERFMREARAAVRINSEHVARVSDVGVFEGGEPYMVMEYLEGTDLAAWLRQRGVLPIEQAVEFLLQACEAIAEAHALGIVHRDLKPSNLFVVRRADALWSVKVLDFGISKLTAVGASGPDSSFTRTEAVMGSPLYMPPEQMEAPKAVDARADIWALGMVLFELITGQAPFVADTLPELCMRIAVSAPRSLRSLRPEAPQALEFIVSRCLEKDRERRYRNVAELAQALIAFGPRRARNSAERISRTIRAAGLAQRAPMQPPSSDREEELSSATLVATHSNTDVPRASSAGVPSYGQRWLSVLATTLGFAVLAGLALGVLSSPPAITRAAAPTIPAAGARTRAEPVVHSPLEEPRALVVPAAVSALAPTATPRVVPTVSAAARSRRATVRPVISAVRAPAPKYDIFDDR